MNYYPTLRPVDIHSPRHPCHDSQIQGHSSLLKSRKTFPTVTLSNGSQWIRVSMQDKTSMSSLISNIHAHFRKYETEENLEIQLWFQQKNHMSFTWHNLSAFAQRDRSTQGKHSTETYILQTLGTISHKHANLVSTLTKSG